MAQRKHEADADGTFSLLHQLARRVINGCYVVGVYRMTQAEAIGEKRGSEKKRRPMEAGDRGTPRGEVEYRECGV